ncbi:MAG: hypothetical protein AB1631_13110, partial [Acidobacteriota bacterium]
MSNSTTHLSDDEIARYSARRMPPVELLAADRHLSHCDKCYARMQESQSSNPLLIASKAFCDTAEDDDTHLTYEQLVSLTDDQLGEIDREILESHLEFCASCEAELSDLREVKERMMTVDERAPGSQTSFREKFLAFWRLPALRVGALSTAALAAFALLAFLLSLPVRRENAALQARVSELERRNESLKEQAERAEEMQNEIAALREENNRLRSIENPSLVSLDDGGARIAIDAKGNLAGLAIAPHYEAIVKEALQSGRVKITTPLRGSAGKAGTLMGDPANPRFRLLAPVNLVIETDRPTFRWEGPDVAATFTVAVFDENLNKVAESEPL